MVHRLENPALHQCPEPWESEQIKTNKMGFWLFLIFFGLGALTLYLVWSYPPSDTSDKFEGYAYSITFMGIGLAFLIGAIYSNFDQKDHWSVDLPYNQKLFQEIHENMKAMLKENNYDYKYKKIRKTSYYRTYLLRSPKSSKLKINYGLRISTGKSTHYYNDMKILNIKMNNLSHAHRLCNDINIILEKVEYKTFADKSGSSKEGELTKKVNKLDNKIKKQFK